MASSNKSPFEITKTIVGVENELQAFSPIALSERAITTLNSKYNIGRDIMPTRKPEIAYFGIGINGNYNINDGNLSTPYIPRMTNLDLFTPLPFRCVAVDEDLSSSERQNYRMRVRRTFNDQQYWCYYLKKIEFIDSAVQITRTNPDTQEEEPYELDPSNLYPNPSIPSPSGVNTPSGTEVNVLLNGLLTIHGHEVVEAVSTIYNDLRRSSISEIGIYTGEDKTITGESGTGDDIQYTEAIYTQLAIHQCSIGSDMSNPTSVLTKQLRLGKGNLFLI